MGSWLTDKHIRFLWVANLIILGGAALVSRGQFLDPYNFQSMAKQLPEIALLAMAVMLAMISGGGGIDLSVVGIANLSAITAGIVAKSVAAGQGQGLEFTLVFVATALLVGTLCGLINGLLIARAGFAPILATLGTQLVFVGLGVALSGGPAVSLGYVEPFVELGNGSLLGLPVPFLIFAGVVGLVSWILTRTRFGFRLYLTGTNAKAAYFTGIKTPTILISTYTLGGILASIAGILIASGASSAKWDYGSSYLLIAILIAVMGGINPEGGSGKMLGLVLAAVALQMLSSALNLLGLSNFLKDFTWGLLLILSIIFTSSWTRFSFSPGRKGPS
ncbi:ABC transporter permease [Meiothermus granaticius]|uniref:Autoinducer 2 import system permease protein LsrD n=1 Tax=Meiothermus granaticius NBRC 107808 TaxID=1227551 RepID=A0A399FA72_9DEIN|nr:ABC transporter permease [Meiothermus granaticius]RIH92606.1 Autoinducer 2 import system permease protein LsrD [Meiothermus granaticius NBRC 107808]GEM87976.1 sugar ABC transporter permease [Meiothermus granaticius NBRC 107808]